jgi:circadian clock protein KaiB
MSEQDGDGRAVGGGARPVPGPPERTALEYQRALDRGSSERYVMRLYVAGNSLRSRAAIENVRRVCDEYLCGRWDLEVIDIYQDQVRSRDDAVIAAPTLVKFEPLPRSRIIGDMTRTEKVLAGLGLTPRPV